MEIALVRDTLACSAGESLLFAPRPSLRPLILAIQANDINPLVNVHVAHTSALEIQLGAYLAQSEYRSIR